jgi:transcriptional regulator with XRE-family HTH domain
MEISHTIEVSKFGRIFVLDVVNYADIGKRVKARRAELGISQEKLAEMTDFSVSHMSAIETGKTKLGLPTIVKVANALQVTVDELLCGSIMQGKAVMQNEFAGLLAQCSPAEAAFVMDMVKSVLKGLREVTAGQ